MLCYLIIFNFAKPGDNSLTSLAFQILQNQQMSNSSVPVGSKDCRQLRCK